MRCQPRRHLALLCLAAGAVAACLPRAAAMPRNNWQEEGTREFVLSGALGSGGGSGGGVIGPDPMNCRNFTFTQRVDHFNRSDARTFLQRYYLCDGYWHRGAREPLFVYLGCEAPLDAPYPSIFMDMARDEGGLLLFIEHRHYGQSLPLGPVASFTNAGLRLLTVEQALADFAAITTAIRQAYRVPRTAASVASGGSYGGSLAAWARLLYPTTFQASLASSSVVRFMVGTESYQRLKRDTSDAMTRHLRAVGGAACAARVALGFATLQGRASWTSEGRAQLAAAASLCPDNVLEGPAEIEGLVALLRDSWWGAFQTLRKKGPDDNAVAAACQRILTAFPATPLGAVAAISNFTRSADLDNAACINAEDSALPFSTKQPRPDDTDWATQYFAQGCLQGLPISTHFWSAPPSIFGVYSAPLSRIAGWCRRVFGVRHPIRVPPQLQYSPRAYQAVGNIIFTSGGLDPWRPGAVLQPLGPTLPAITTPGASHCQDLRQAKATTLAAVNATQAVIKSYIRRWVIDWPKPGHGHGQHY